VRPLWQLQPFSRDRVLEYGEAGGVAENQLRDVQEAATRLGVAWHGSATFVLSSDDHAQNAAPSRMHVVYSQGTRRNGSELSRQHVARVITCATGSCRTVLPTSAIVRTMSRSRQNADEASVAAEDHQRTDAMRGEQLRRRRQIGCRFDADDVAALGGKNGLQAHARPVKDDFVPILWSGARGVYRGKRCRCWNGFGFRLTPGSFTKLENLIFNQDTTSTVFAGSLPIMDCAEGVGAAKGCFLRLDQAKRRRQTSLARLPCSRLFEKLTVGLWAAGPDRAVVFSAFGNPVSGPLASRSERGSSYFPSAHSATFRRAFNIGLRLR
jgi:hypothetical protein